MLETPVDRSCLFGSGQKGSYSTPHHFLFFRGGGVWPPKPNHAAAFKEGVLHEVATRGNPIITTRRFFYKKWPPKGVPHPHYRPERGKAQLNGAAQFKPAAISRRAILEFSTKTHMREQMSIPLLIIPPLLYCCIVLHCIVCVFRH